MGTSRQGEVGLQLTKLGYRQIAGGLWHIGQTGSTNTDLVSILTPPALDLPFASALLVDQQSAGRGRYQRSWADQNGESLLISALISVPASQLSWVSALSGLAIYQVLTDLSRQIPDWHRKENRACFQLKWPNDLLKDGKKLAGILSELVNIHQDQAQVVVGLGLNLGVVPDAPPSATWLPPTLRTAIRNRAKQQAARIYADAPQTDLSAGLKNQRDFGLIDTGLPPRSSNSNAASLDLSGLENQQVSPGLAERIYLSALWLKQLSCLLGQSPAVWVNTWSGTNMASKRQQTPFPSLEENPEAALETSFATSWEENPTISAEENPATGAETSPASPSSRIVAWQKAYRAALGDLPAQLKVRLADGQLQTIRPLNIGPEAQLIGQRITDGQNIAIRSGEVALPDGSFPPFSPSWLRTNRHPAPITAPQTRKDKENR